MTKTAVLIALGALLTSVTIVPTFAAQTLVTLAEPPASRVGASCLWATLVDMELGRKRCQQPPTPNEAAIQQAINELQLFWTSGGEGKMVPETATHYLDAWSLRWARYGDAELKKMCAAIDSFGTMFTPDALQLLVQRQVANPIEAQMPCL